MGLIPKYWHEKQMCVSYRAELDCKVEEVRHEMESRLDSQRRHMVQKESLLRSEVDELKVRYCQHQSLCSQNTLRTKVAHHLQIKEKILI